MYRLEFLPVARRDMLEIVRYISFELKNPDAADRLATDLINAAENVLTFPYSTPAYRPIVRNYLMFYWVDEAKKVVTVARVMYAKRDHARLLE